MRSPRSPFTPRAPWPLQYELALDQLYLQGSYCTSAGHGSNYYNKRDFVYLLHCVALIEYPRPPPRIILVESARSRCWILSYCLKILDLGEKSITGHSGHALSLIMIPIEGAASSRVEEEEEETFSKARSIRPNLYR